MTLASFLALSDASALHKGASNVFNDAPFAKLLPTIQSSKGGVHTYERYITQGSAGFRDINTGAEITDSVSEIVTVTLKVLDASFVKDLAFANAYKGGQAEMLAKQAEKKIASALKSYQKQVLNGGAGGFDGFKDLYPSLATAGVYNATGSTANTGSSVYLVKLGEDNVVGIADGTFRVSDKFTQLKVDGDGNSFPVSGLAITGYCGVQVGSNKSVCRICNLTAQAGKGMTDDVYYNALAAMPAGWTPDVIVMGTRSAAQLRTARGAMNYSGNAIAPVTDINGIPVIVTDSILATEAIVS